MKDNEFQDINLMMLAYAALDAIRKEGWPEEQKTETKEMVSA